MWRALRGVFALALAAGAVSAAGPALPGPHDEKNDHGDVARRLDEMKVNLALLSDPVTFPYYLGAHAEGESLEVGGCVPDEAVRRRAVELARRNCSRTVTDRLVIRADLNPRPPLRVEVMEKEGSELLVRELGEAGRRIQVEGRPDGLVTVLGSIGSVEEKLAVSRLFRQVAGCTGVVNQLSVRPVVRDGHRVIPVTRDGSQTVPLAALGGETEHAVSPLRTVAAPSPLHSLHGAEAHKEELSLPFDPSVKSSDGREEVTERTTTPSKPVSRPATKPVPKPGKAEGTATPSGSHRTPSSVDALSAPKPPASWKEADLRWEPVGEQPPALKASTAVKPAPKEEDRRTTARPPEAQATVNSPLERTWHWQDYGKLTGSPKPGATAAPPPESREASNHLSGLPAQRLGTEDRPLPESREASNRPSELPPLRSARAWPPAFAPRSQEPANGRPGVIIFDEPVSSSAASHGPTRPARPAALVDLVRKVNAACGKQARDVLVEVQRDGSLLVKVKATAAAEKQLMSKIMTIPDMASPNVHLAMEIIP